MAIKMYFPAESIVHRIDARAKIILLICYLILVFIFSDPIYLIPFAVFSIGLFYLSHLPIEPFKLLIKTIIILGIFMLIVQGFFWGGDRVIFTLFPGWVPLIGGKGRFTFEGVMMALAMNLRLVGLMMSVPVLMMTIPPENLILSLCHFKLPYKYAFIVSSTLSFTPILQSTYNEIRAAQKARAFNPAGKNSIVIKLKSFIPQLVPLIIISMRKAFNLQIAIESRAFGRMFRTGTSRTYLTEMTMKLVDYLVIILSIGLLVFGIVLRICGYGTFNL